MEGRKRSRPESANGAAENGAPAEKRPALPATAKADTSEEAKRRRQEKLREWRAKKLAKAKSPATAAPTVASTASSSSSTSAAQTNASAPTASSAASATPSTTTSVPATMLKKPLKLKVPGKRNGKNKGKKPTSSAVSAAFEEEKDHMTDLDWLDEPSKETNASDNSRQGAKQSDEMDQDDVLEKFMGDDEPAVGGIGQSTASISLDDLMNELGTEGRAEAGAEERKSPPTEAEESHRGADASDDDETDEEYRRAFLAQFERRGNRILDPSSNDVPEQTDQAATAPREGSKAKEVGPSSSTSRTQLPVSKEEFGRLYDEDQDDSLYQGEEWTGGSGPSALELLRERMAKKVLHPVDHTKVDYPPFRKNFYVESPELQRMTPAEVHEERAAMELKVRGAGCPRPLRTWTQCGLSAEIMAVLEKESYRRPFPIQRQAFPVIMSGRDMIGIARTGSGKTLAFLLPLLRHVRDQPPLANGEGPIALILAPARELAVQIYHETRKFTKALGLRVTPVYGGAPIAEQIAGVKAGSHIVIATPGRLIDLLSLNNGRVMSLFRTTFVVLDEADRMFDMGFGPQVERIVQNVRPDRQTVMFSATFPEHVAYLAKSILYRPIEVVVGGRSVVSHTVTQFVEVRPEHSKFRRLMQLLGHWYERGPILIFVDRKERCDDLFTKLIQAGYPCLAVHGGKGQDDREATIADFKSGHQSVMVATSVAGRGLDVRNLTLVVNYNVPNHLEDYVHRVGRTGRAENRGTAFTFITPEEGAYAPDLVRALTESKQEVPKELQQLADDHFAKVEAGEARRRRSGYATKGYRFDGTDVTEDVIRKELQRQQFRHSQGELSQEEWEDIERELHDQLEALRRKSAKHTPASSTAEGGEASSSSAGGGDGGPRSGVWKERVSDRKISSGPTEPVPTEDQIRMLWARANAARMAAARGVGSLVNAASAEAELRDAERRMAEARVTESDAARAREQGQQAVQVLQRQLRQAGRGETAGWRDDEAQERFFGEVEINDYPQQARMRVMSGEVARNIAEWLHCGIVTKGVFVYPGRAPPAGERKLYLLVEGPSEIAVRRAQGELRRILEEVTATVGFDKSADAYGKF